MMVGLVFALLVALANVAPLSAIGENPMDLNTFAGIITGIGHMLQNNVETIDLPSKLMMGRWFQMYKAAVNFDVYKTQMFCSVAYFKPNAVMGEDGFSMEEAYKVSAKNGPVETYKRDMNKVGSGQYWMYTEEYFYPRQFYIIKAGPDFDNETMEGNVQYFVATDANRLALMVYARDPLTFYQDKFVPNHNWGKVQQGGTQLPRRGRIRRQGVLELAPSHLPGSRLRVAFRERGFRPQSTQEPRSQRTRQERKRRLAKSHRRHNPKPSSISMLYVMK
ncbi:hypothetical protein L596_004199 [Steinernema carpocapsae]|uniref:Lipocalin/cytosolic fatty-acid binding domain-containing protein n=1 Tax=Steinernema carpocapsae TaxID=34508 RepID=A0A4U8UV20_STECR|nr:hypothetical protein L596_004199 [Steinernema carpocapsae]